MLNYLVHDNITQIKWLSDNQSLINKKLKIKNFN